MDGKREIMDEDALIIERFRRGDRAAFDELLEKYQKEIFYLALRILRNREDAEEAAQQAFINAFNGIGQFRGGAAFRTWLYRIAINVANSRLRRPDRQVEYRDEVRADSDEEVLSPVDTMVVNEAAGEALKALDELGEKQKMVVLLRIYQELPYGEIARIVGCTENAAKVHFHYGIENLRKKLSGHEL